MGFDVVVVGGGFGGLFTAHLLRRRGLEVVVVDQADTPGGVARTCMVDGYVLEPAAGTFLLPHPHLTPVLASAGVDVVPASGVRRYVYTRGRLIGFEPSPTVAFSPLLPVTAKARLALEPFVPSGGDGDETLAAFLRRRLGGRAGELIAALAARGVFAGDPDRLSAEAAFPALVALEREAGSLTRGAVRRLRRRPKGMPRPMSHLPVGTMADAARRLAGSGDAWRGGFTVSAVRATGDGRWAVEGPETLTASQVVLAVAPAVAQTLLGDPDPVPFPAAPVAVVWLGGPNERMPIPEGFGYLAGPDTDLVGLGCLFESSYAPARAPEGRSLVKVIAGGASRPDVVDLDDDVLTGRIVDEVGRVLGRDIQPDFAFVARHRPGIPQYEPGHLARLAEMERRWPPAVGVHFAGWGYRGVGVAHVAADAGRLADRIVEAVR